MLINVLSTCLTCIVADEQVYSDLS